LKRKITLTLQYFLQLYSIDGTKFLVAWSGLTQGLRGENDVTFQRSFRKLGRGEILENSESQKMNAETSHSSYYKSDQNSDYIFLMHFTLFPVNNQID
jgi:hypothetical protein